MVRMQIQFTESEVQGLRNEAAQRRISISAVVREAVDQRLARQSAGVSLEERKRRAKAACGRFRSGLGDVSARHDEYFVDSIDS
jgi:post-segregation antitoxin (ccd killing protein)